MSTTDDFANYAMARHVPDMARGFAVLTSYGELGIEAEEAQRHPEIAAGIGAILKSRVGDTEIDNSNLRPTLIDASQGGGYVPFLGADASVFTGWSRALMACLCGDGIATEADWRDVHDLAWSLISASEILQGYESKAVRQIVAQAKAGGES